MNSISKLTLILAFALISILTISQIASFREFYDKTVNGQSSDVALQQILESNNIYQKELNEVITKLQSIISASTNEIGEQSLRMERIVDKLDTNALNEQIERVIKFMDERTGFPSDDSSVERYSKDELYKLFEKTVMKEVRWNNWDMGCLDNQFMAPYFRAILYRRGWKKGRGGQTIIDIGANTGDDTVSMSKIFHPIIQMCAMYSTPVQIVSVEPSPKVFCEMTDMLTAHLTKEDKQHMNIIRLNVALSSHTGHLVFRDPGNEGGQLLGNNFSDLSMMTTEEYAQYSECKYPGGEFRNMTLDGERQTSVPTYTLDLLVASLENLGKIRQYQEIFVVKIDTEGHDYNTLLGAKELLKNKRITFIVFEVWSNIIVKSISQHMAQFEYQCFLLTKYALVPVHETDWWYPHLTNFTTQYWGNGLCALKDSKDLAMLWRMYHSDDLKLLNSYELL